MKLLEASNLHKTYLLGATAVPVLRGVSLEVHAGEFLAILGASGSGKSTLLHLLGGLDEPDVQAAGSWVNFRGLMLRSFSQSQLDDYRARSVGFVFQFYHLLPELNVLQNVCVAAMARWKFGYFSRKGEIEARARELLTEFGLAQRLKHKPVELSGGERQRVAIARALINDPQILLADEPTGNLDRKTGETILDLLIKSRRGERALVMVTHDTEVAKRADRVVRIVDGVISKG
ncbi:MAG: ABC transporter ATP-binding protein [Phycisphaerales bacterium]|nr:ABC transporter ATP-binding protein [Phycisphaerales bacterium]